MGLANEDSITGTDLYRGLKYNVFQRMTHHEHRVYAVASQERRLESGFGIEAPVRRFHGTTVIP